MGKNKEEDKKYMFQLVVPDEEKYKRLLEIQETYPKLTFDNKGYEKLSKELQKEFAPQIKEISELLTSSMEDFRSFNNFKKNKEGILHIRMQYSWDASFVGVGYFDLRHWHPEEHGKH